MTIGHLRWFITRTTAQAWERWRARHTPHDLDEYRITPPRERSAAVIAGYGPLYVYLERRYASTVVLTFEQIEALLGFAPPPSAFVETTWWTRPASPGAPLTPWAAAGRRATPRLHAGVIAFDRID